MQHEEEKAIVECTCEPGGSKPDWEANYEGDAIRKPVGNTSKLRKRAEESDIKGGHGKGHSQGRSAFIVDIVQTES